MLQTFTQIIYALAFHRTGHDQLGSPVKNGKTLLENNLAPFETIVPISARLVSNKASYSFKAKKIEQIKKGLLEQVKKDD